MRQIHIQPFGGPPTRLLLTSPIDRLPEFVTYKGTIYHQSGGSNYYVQIPLTNVDDAEEIWVHHWSDHSGVRCGAKVADRLRLTSYARDVTCTACLEILNGILREARALGV